MDSVHLLIVSDAIPDVVTRALTGEGRHATLDESVLDSKEELAAYVHWDSQRGDVPVQLHCLTADFPDTASCDEALRPDRVTEALRRSRDTVYVAAGSAQIIVDGTVEPGTVRASYVFRRLPHLSLDEFRDHWLNVHGPLWAQVPGVLRYVQNHPLEAGSTTSASLTTHDGWSDVWFSDMESYSRALASPERHEVSLDGATLLDYDSLRIFVASEAVAQGPAV